MQREKITVYSQGAETLMTKEIGETMRRAGQVNGSHPGQLLHETELLFKGERR